MAWRSPERIIYPLRGILIRTPPIQAQSLLGAAGGLPRLQFQKRSKYKPAGSTNAD